jgi:hypothetical protein
MLRNLPVFLLSFKICADLYDDFFATDRWTRKQVHCLYQALIVAVATRHADAIDVKYLVDGRPVWIALPHPAWVEYNRLTGKVITDPLAVQTAGHYLKEAIESGFDNGREMYTLTVDETLRHLTAVLQEFRAPEDAIPAAPSLSEPAR